MYLLDTSVISEVQRPLPDPRVLGWISETPASDLFLSAVTLGELQRGVENIAPRSPEKARILSQWIDGLSDTLAVLALDGPAFRIHARLIHGKDPRLSEDALIAATAIRYGHTLVSRNVRDFKALGIEVLDPFV